MKSRDKAILDSLTKFRILSREQIIAIHFKDLKDTISSANKVLKRLERDKRLNVYKHTRPYSYYPADSKIKAKSTKVPHFEAIADFYLSLCDYVKPTVFEVEWKVGQKGTIEPDIFMVWKNAPFFVEIQRDHYTKKRMDAKYKRYREYFNSGMWKHHSKHFPFIWIVTHNKYRNLDWSPLRVYQSEDVGEFVRTYLTKKKPAV